MDKIKLIEKYHKEKTPIFVNGIGVGKITNIEEGYFDFEVIKKKDKEIGKGKDKKTEKVLVKEVFHIFDITTISTGEKVLPKSQTEEKIDEDLGEL